MSKSAILSSSIAKKYWMAFTGLFLCLFLVGHLLGNLQLILYHGAEGKRMFNEYAFFMTHNPLIMVVSYITYASILFHAIDGIILTVQNAKARKKNYAYNKPSANSSISSRNMGILGTVILIFIVTHMVNFWARMHFDEGFPLHTDKITDKESGQSEDVYLLTTGNILLKKNVSQEGPFEIKNDTDVYFKNNDIKYGTAIKDLHSMVMAFFGQDKSKEGIPTNEYALLATILYTLAMIALSFHLWHGFASAFQSIGLRTHKYKGLIEGFGKTFALIIPTAFAVIPIIIYLTK